MTRKRVQQPLLIRIQALSFSKEAERSQPFVVTRRDAHEDDGHRFRSSLKGGGDVLGYGASFDVASALAGALDEPVSTRRKRRTTAIRGGIEFCFASTMNSDATPYGIQHSRGALRKSFQKIRQVTRLRRLHGELHQFFRLLRYRDRRFRFPAPQGETRRRYRFWSAHEREVCMGGLNLRAVMLFYPTGESQSESIAVE